MKFSRTALPLIPLIAIVATLWFCRNDASIINFFTGIGALATVVYCVYTISIVKATQASVDLLRLQSEEESRARITIVPYIFDSKLMLKLANVGKLPATDLRLSLTTPVHLIGNRRLLNDAPIVSKGVKAFQAGVEINFTLGVGREVMRRAETERTFSIHAHYKTGIRDQEHHEEIWIDLDSWWASDVSRSDVDRAHIDAAKALQEIAEAHT